MSQIKQTYRPSNKQQIPAVATAVSSDMTWMVLAAIACLGLIVMIWVGGAFLPPIASELSWALPLALGAAAVLLGMALRYPRRVFNAFLLLSMNLMFVFEVVHIPLGFMKLYVQDIVFLFNAALIVWRASIGQTQFRRIRFNKYVFLFFLLGIWGVVNGLLITKNQFDDVFGDFRRAFFYFMNYFVVLYLTDSYKDVKILRDTLLLGSVFLIFKGIFQAATGQFYTRRFGDAAHILSYMELIFISFSIYYGLVQLVFNEKVNRGLWISVIGLGLLVSALGNYRASWLGLLGGIMVMFLFVPGNKKLLLAGFCGLVSIFLTLAVLIMWDAEILEGQTTVGKELMMKANPANAPADVNVIWRVLSYRAALEQWLTSPIIGTGLGTYLEFAIITSTGRPDLAEGHNIHNSLLWLLMVEGIIGLAAILAVHASYLSAAIRAIRSTHWLEGRITLIACVSYYTCMMVATVFQNYLENAIPVTVFSAVAALTMLTIYYMPSAGEEAKMVAGKTA
ncbi:MAG: O-antigen ligase family protein [Candidatus Sumerlaeota bacterium]|nr:O-antigen ligase family protein [Candidatus Sumerlaeota bacterium]